MDEKTVNVTHNYYDWNQNSEYNLCPRVLRIEDQIYSFLNDYIEKHSFNEIIKLDLKITYDQKELVSKCNESLFNVMISV